MGRASRWFRGLLGLNAAPKNKLTWGFSKSRAEKRQHKSLQPVSPNPGGDDDATAAEVHLTSGGRNISTAIQRGGDHAIREDRAAVTVQSHFRAYLSRRALRALKALVKLQALVRGHLVRKQTACALRRLQALVRAQIQIRASRILNSDSTHSYSRVKSSHFNTLDPATPEKFERITRACSMKQEQSTMLKRNNSKPSRMRERSSFDQGSYHPHTDEEKSSMIPDLDSHFLRSLSAQSLSPLMFRHKAFHNSPTFYTASSSRKGAFTPTESDDSRSCFSNYSDHPNYMAYTESSKAKARSHSAPRQRSQMERSSSAKG